MPLIHENGLSGSGKKWATRTIPPLTNWPLIILDWIVFPVVTLYWYNQNMIYTGVYRENNGRTTTNYEGTRWTTECRGSEYWTTQRNRSSYRLVILSFVVVNKTCHGYCCCWHEMAFITANFEFDFTQNISIFNIWFT